MRDDGKVRRPHPDEVMDLVRSTEVTTTAEAEALNEAVLAMTRSPLQRPATPGPVMCTTHPKTPAVLQEARDCKGCDAAAEAEAHTHPHFMCEVCIPDSD